MSLPHQRALYKDCPHSKIPRLQPVNNEGRCIRARTVSLGISLKKIADGLGVSRTSVYCVVHGKRRSARIESEIARILGKESWNEVVLEARSEIQKKPVGAILKEMRREQKAHTNGTAYPTKESFEKATQIIQEGIAALSPKARERLERKVAGL